MLPLVADTWVVNHSPFPEKGSVAIYLYVRAVFCGQGVSLWLCTAQELCQCGVVPADVTLPSGCCGQLLFWVPALHMFFPLY